MGVVEESVQLVCHAAVLSIFLTVNQIKDIFSYSKEKHTQYIELIYK